VLRIFLPAHQDTQNFGCLLGENLPRGTTILLSGDLGAGKTTLVQGIGQGLNISEPITSPTFTLINEYLDGRIPLYHLDLYRLEPSQVGSIYPEMYWDGMEVESGITAIEWSQRLVVQPPSYLKIELLALESKETKGRQVQLFYQGVDNCDLKFIDDFARTFQP
jgi:tRNA threonylcarbamoyladenosine biosynthesis protein TsaE